MTDQPTLDGQTTDPNQQVNGTQPTTTAGEDYKKRFDGAILKIQELTLGSRSKDAELATKASELEQLRTQLSLKDVEKTAAVGERDRQLQEAITKNQQQETELKVAKALQLKLKVIKKLNRPELLKIIDHIPALEDEAVLETVMKDFGGFADDLVKARETQLLAGITPGIGAGATAPTRPASNQGWEDHINGLPLGSKDRAKALDDYGDWLEQQSKSK